MALPVASKPAVHARMVGSRLCFEGFAVMFEGQVGRQIAVRQPSSRED